MKFSKNDTNNTGDAMWKTGPRNALLAAGITFALAACMHETEDNEIVVKDTMAIVATIQPDFVSGGAHSVITVDENKTASNNVLPTNSSDLIVAASGSSFYRIDRTHGSIQKFDAATPDTAVFDYSVNGTDATSNPHDLVIVNDTKAYVFRYNTNKVWEVNPSATTEQDFKVAEIDFSHYADPDGNVDPQSGVVVGNRLFVLLQNMEDKGNYEYDPATAYVAVIDIETNEELDTDSTQDGVQPITLPVENPVKMSVRSSLDKIFIAASGDTYPANDYTGGIATIDINDYSVQTLINDNADTHAITNIAIVSDTVGYFVGYKGWQDNYLMQFNPSTGEISPGTIAAFDAKDLADIEVDINGKLWVASFAEAGVYVLDPATNEIEGSFISTGLSPYDITFVSLP